MKRERGRHTRDGFSKKEGIYQTKTKQSLVAQGGNCNFTFHHTEGERRVQSRKRKHEKKEKQKSNSIII